MSKGSALSAPSFPVTPELRQLYAWPVAFEKLTRPPPGGVP